MPLLFAAKSQNNNQTSPSADPPRLLRAKRASSWRGRVRGGEALRAAMNYDHMYNLGGSEVAKKMQQKAFSKLSRLNNIQPRVSRLSSNKGPKAYL